MPSDKPMGQGRYRPTSWASCAAMRCTRATSCDRCEDGGLDFSECTASEFRAAAFSARSRMGREFRSMTIRYFDDE